MHGQSTLDAINCIHLVPPLPSHCATILFPLSSSDLYHKTGDCSEIKPKHLVCLGGFRNTRKDIKYEGLKMELDETTYEWGKCYEIEVETV